jgi:hypothetical protein
MLWHLHYCWEKAGKTSVRVTEEFDTPHCADYSTFRDSLGWPAEYQFTSVTCGDFSQPSVGTICRNKGFPASANFETKNSVSALMWSAKKEIPKFSWICLLPTYKGALVTVRKHMDCNAFSSRTWLRTLTSRSWTLNPSQDGSVACRAAHRFWRTRRFSC